MLGKLQQSLGADQSRVHRERGDAVLAQLPASGRGQAVVGRFDIAYAAPKSCSLDSGTAKDTVTTRLAGVLISNGAHRARAT